MDEDDGPIATIKLTFNDVPDDIKLGLNVFLSLSTILIILVIIILISFIFLHLYRLFRYILNKKITKYDDSSYLDFE